MMKNVQQKKMTKKENKEQDNNSMDATLDGP